MKDSKYGNPESIKTFLQSEKERLAKIYSVGTMDGVRNLDCLQSMDVLLAVHDGVNDDYGKPKLENHDLYSQLLNLTVTTRLLPVFTKGFDIGTGESTNVQYISMATADGFNVNLVLETAKTASLLVVRRVDFTNKQEGEFVYGVVRVQKLTKNRKGKLTGIVTRNFFGMEKSEKKFIPNEFSQAVVGLVVGLPSR